VESVAVRVGVDPMLLARFNAVTPNMNLRPGEILALPSRVQEAPRIGGNDDTISITSLAEGAIDRANGQSNTAATPNALEPVRHQVVRGETAFSIARLYNVTTRSLAEWNGLATDMRVREGQYLMIPPSQRGASQVASEPITAPGIGTPTPVPPSAATPLPLDEPPAAEIARAAEEARPPSPNLATERTTTSSARLAMPVQGRVIRTYTAGRNEGIGIAASAGTAVHAAADGTVAAITQDTDQVPIIVIRHDGNLLTVYANLDNIQVERNARVQRGDTIATVRAASPSFLHFEVREGFESVDPMPFLE
jgi:murein DD-endopeptidase MepM/ murein hydrolase activator NlpD